MNPLVPSLRGGISANHDQSEQDEDIRDENLNDDSLPVFRRPVSFLLPTPDASTPRNNTPSSRRSVDESQQINGRRPSRRDTAPFLDDEEAAQQEQESELNNHPVIPTPGMLINTVNSRIESIDQGELRSDLNRRFDELTNFDAGLGSNSRNAELTNHTTGSDDPQIESSGTRSVDQTNTEEHSGSVGTAGSAVTRKADYRKNMLKQTGTLSQKLLSPEDENRSTDSPAESYLPPLSLPPSQPLSIDLGAEERNDILALPPAIDDVRQSLDISALPSAIDTGCDDYDAGLPSTVGRDHQESSSITALPQIAVDQNSSPPEHASEPSRRLTRLQQAARRLNIITQALPASVGPSTSSTDPQSATTSRWSWHRPSIANTRTPSTPTYPSRFGSDARGSVETAATSVDDVHTQAEAKSAENEDETEDDVVENSVDVEHNHAPTFGSRITNSVRHRSSVLFNSLRRRDLMPTPASANQYDSLRDDVDSTMNAEPPARSRPRLQSSLRDHARELGTETRRKLNSKRKSIIDFFKREQNVRPL